MQFPKWVKYGLVHLTLLLYGVFSAFVVDVFVKRHEPGIAGIFILIFMSVVVFFFYALEIDEPQED